jgi:hypothetical protein
MALPNNDRTTARRLVLNSIWQDTPSREAKARAVLINLRDVVRVVAIAPKATDVGDGWSRINGTFTRNSIGGGFGVPCLRPRDHRLAGAGRIGHRSGRWARWRRWGRHVRRRPEIEIADHQRQPLIAAVDPQIARVGGRRRLQNACRKKHPWMNSRHQSMLRYPAIVALISAAY